MPSLRRHHDVSAQRGVDTGTVRRAVGDRRREELGTVAEAAQTDVAFAAEQAADALTRVTMVDPEPLSGPPARR